MKTLTKDDWTGGKYKNTTDGRHVDPTALAILDCDRIKPNKTKKKKLKLTEPELWAVPQHRLLTAGSPGSLPGQSGGQNDIEEVFFQSPSVLSGRFHPTDVPYLLIYHLGKGKGEKNHENSVPQWSILWRKFEPRPTGYQTWRQGRLVKQALMYVKQVTGGGGDILTDTQVTHF
jgi:hypothetical protein